MRKVYRNSDTLTYWNKRWGDFETDSDTFCNKEIYPIKYVDRIMDKNKMTLDAGCGLGRVVKHYHNLGYKIAGCDYSEVAVKKLNDANPELDVCFGNVLHLPYDNEQFDNILLLGVFHSIESIEDVEKGVKESVRCLKTNGHMLVAVRVDNLENYFIDSITNFRGGKGTQFHKWCFKEEEMTALLKKHSLEIRGCELVTNVSFFHKFKFLRKNKDFDEKIARSQGFQLNGFGDFIYKTLKKVAPKSFGTTCVITTQKVLGNL